MDREVSQGKTWLRGIPKQEVRTQEDEAMAPQGMFYYQPSILLTC